MIRKTQGLMFVAGIIAIVMLFDIVSSGEAQTSNQTQQGAAQSSSPPKEISSADLKHLRWIEGTWRGTGDVEKPFFERYYFENDTTLVVEGFDDETVSKVTDVTRFELKEKQFGNGGDSSRWAATKIDKDSITFEPVARARNIFRWERESKDVWKAVLTWPATADKPARQKIYKMERWTAPKK